MNHFLHGVARATSEAFVLPAPIIEIGSFQVPGQEEVSNLRSLFPGKQYTGVDMRPGRGVDCVADVEDLPYDDGSVGTVIAMSTFEHVPRFWRGFDEIHRVLRPDGVLLVSCPFYFHIHSYPSDYWRFTPEALEIVLDCYPTRVIGWHGPKNRPANVWAIAFREQYPTLTGRQLAQYRRLLKRHAREPLSWFKIFRYRMARLLCGRGPFAPYLEQAKWEILWRSQASEEVKGQIRTIHHPI
jgi:SAM-dependent methyltransferase